MANPMDVQLRKIRMMSLEDIARRKVATLLCNRPLKYMRCPNVEEELEEERAEPRQKLFKKVIDGIGLPETMREPLVNVMTPVFLEVIRWLKFHGDYLTCMHSKFFYREFLYRFHWTYLGTINYLKTAEALIRNEKLNIEQRFKIACLYCLDEDIQRIWLRLPKISKRSFYEDDGSSTYSDERDIVEFWVWILRGDGQRLQPCLFRLGLPFTSIFQYAFEFFALKGYAAATEYFFKRLTRKQKAASLLRTAKGVATRDGALAHALNDISCFLLKHLSAAQCESIFESSPYGMLRIAMDWPRQEAFPEVLKLTVPYLKKEHYRQVHFILARKFKLVYDSRKLFMDLFEIIPRNFRDFTYYLPGLLQRTDTEMLAFMFKNMELVQVMEIFLNPLTQYGCYELVKEDKWEFLETLIRASGLPKEGIEIFEIAFCLHFASLLGPEVRDRFNKMLRDIYSNQDSTSSSDEDQTDPEDAQPEGQPDGQVSEEKPPEENEDT